eukprot:c19069_g5_i1 orf=1103-1414(+)
MLSHPQPKPHVKLIQPSRFPKKAHTLGSFISNMDGEIESSYHCQLLETPRNSTFLPFPFPIASVSVSTLPVTHSYWKLPKAPDFSCFHFCSHSHFPGPLKHHQ